MHFDSQRAKYFQRFSQPSAQPRSLLQKIVLTLVTAGVFVVTLMFSVVLFAVALTLGVVGAGYLWWKLRAARKKMQMQEAQRRGTVIEGVVIREVDTREEDARDKRER